MVPSSNDLTFFFEGRRLRGEEECKLLNDFFSKALQGCLGLLAFTILIYKRHILEVSARRPWRIWALDSAKQGVSSLVAHFSGMIIAWVLTGVTEKGNEVR